MNVEADVVTTEDWVPAWRRAHSDGFIGLDFLTAIDRGDHLELLGRAVRGFEDRFIAIIVGDEPVPTITQVYPAAAWHEREIAEMFGVVFVGHDTERLLTRDGDPPLMLKSAPLAARVEKPWPGAGKRNRKPGVPSEWLVEP